jgi:hypothetical protein
MSARRTRISGWHARLSYRPGSGQIRAQVSAIAKAIAPKPPTNGDARAQRQFLKRARTDPVGALIEREIQ